MAHPLYDRAPCQDFTSPSRPPGRVTSRISATWNSRPPAPSTSRTSTRARATWKSVPWDWCACSTTATKPSGPWNPHLDAEDLQVGLRHMLLTRIFDDRMQRTQRAGKDLLLHALASARKPWRWRRPWRCSPATCCFPSYRQQGIYMVRGKPLVDLMCQLLSNTRDMCKGRQLPVMYHWKAGQHLLDLRQSDYPVSAGGGLGHGGGDQATKITSPAPGSARARAPRPTFTTACCSPPSTRRR